MIASVTFRRLRTVSFFYDYNREVDKRYNTFEDLKEIRFNREYDRHSKILYLFRINSNLKTELCVY